MRSLQYGSVVALTICVAFACSDDERPDDHAHDESGGSPSSGGSSSGGRQGSGGTTSSGGTTASGGVTSSGGNLATGGTDASAGGVDGGETDGSAGETPEDSGTDGAVEPDAAPPSVTLRFKAKVGTSDFHCGQSYPNVGSTQVTVQPLDFRFYVEKVWLLTASGDEVPLTLSTRAPWQTPDVALLDFEERRGLCFSGDAATNAVITGDVPPGDYTGVAFTVGVPSALNHSDPANYPPPLNAPGMPWSWLMGFRFLKAELQGPAATLGLGYAHSGSTSCTGSPQEGTVTCSRPNRNKITLTGFDVATNVIVVDLAAIFEGSDLSADTECHGAGAACAPMYAALGINVANGRPSSSQTAFRVE